MKLWHVAALLMVLGIAYVLVARPTMPSQTGASASSSNAILGVISGGLQLGSKIFDKVSAPSASSIVNGGTYYAGDSYVDGNTLKDDSGKTLTYGTD